MKVYELRQLGLERTKFVTLSEEPLTVACTKWNDLVQTETVLASNASTFTPMLFD
jgi:hypothetical protein